MLKLLLMILIGSFRRINSATARARLIKSLVIDVCFFVIEFIFDVYFLFIEFIILCIVCGVDFVCEFEFSFARVFASFEDLNF